MVSYDPIKNQRWRMGIMHHYKELSHNLTKTCRYFGISRYAFYRWRTRYLDLGEQDLLDRSRRPNRSPRETKPEIVAKIIYLRHTYHFLGPGKLWFILSAIMIYMSAAPASGGSLKTFK